jgi:hypothetical protein
MNRGSFRVWCSAFTETEKVVIEEVPGCSCPVAGEPWRLTRSVPPRADPDRHEKEYNVLDGSASGIHYLSARAGAGPRAGNVHNTMSVQPIQPLETVLARFSVRPDAPMRDA